MNADNNAQYIEYPAEVTKGQTGACDQDYKKCNLD
jgi:hypothetical protein